jgi:hypothetical protein
MNYFDEELRETEDRLRRNRATLDPLESDQIKRLAISRAARPRIGAAKGFAMKRRLSVLMTCAFVGVGTPAALAVCGRGSGGSQGGSGSSAQYRPSCGDHDNWGGQRCDKGGYRWHWRLAWGWSWQGHRYTWQQSWIWVYDNE